MELVHEALIRHWRPLEEWLVQDRGFRIWQNRLRQALRAWEEQGRDEGALLRGAPLVEAQERLNTYAGELSPPEWAYIEASLALREREAAEKEAQRQRELTTARRLAEETEARRRTEQQRSRVFFGGLVVAVLLACTAGFFWQQANQRTEIARDAQAEAESERNAAVKAKDEAETQRQLALARELAAQSQLSIGRTGEDLIRSGLLAVESLKTTHTLSGYLAWAKVMDLLPRRVARVRLSHEDSVREVAFSPDGQHLATVTEDGTVRVGCIPILWVLRQFQAWG